MIKCKDGKVEINGNSFELITDSIDIMVTVIESLVENGSLDAKDIPTVLEVVTSALERETRPLIRKNNNKYN